MKLSEEKIAEFLEFAPDAGEDKARLFLAV